MPTYIYAITAADHPLRLDGLSGVGEPASELRTVKTGSSARWSATHRPTCGRSDVISSPTRACWRG